MQRRWVLWLLMAFFAYVVVTSAGEIETLAKTLAQGQWQWIAVAVLLQCGYYTLYAVLFQAAFFTVDIREHIGQLLPLFFASLFVDIAAPSGGASSAALYVDHAARNGHPPARAAAGVLLARLVDYGTFFIVLVVGLIYLALYGRLQIYQVVGALILLVIVGSMGGVLVLGRLDPGLLARILGRLERLVNGIAARVRLRPLLPADWGERNAADFTEAALAIAAHPERLSRIQAIAIAIYTLHVLCLYALFLAFRQPIHFGPLLAGYAIGMLFWVVTITPHGIGVVEGVMVLLYTSFGVPAEKATVVVLTFRGLTLWLPLLIGFFAMRRLKSFRAQGVTRGPVTVVRIAALVTAAMGVLTLIESLRPPASARLLQLADLASPNMQGVARIVVTLSSFALLLLAMNLAHHRRHAWTGTLLVLAVSGIALLFQGLNYEAALLALALMLCLNYLRPYFHERTPQPAFRNGLIVLAAAVAFTTAYGAIGFTLLGQHFAQAFEPSRAISETVTLLTRFGDPGLIPLTPFAGGFVISIYMVAASTLAYGLFTLARPLMAWRAPSEAAHARARTIIAENGKTQLAQLAVLPDKSYLFTPGNSLITYTVKGRVALALGDPVGPSEDAEAAIVDFKENCVARRWLPVFYLVRADYLPFYARQRLSHLAIARRSSIALASFGLGDAAVAGPVSRYHRLTEMGYRAEVIDPPQSDKLLSELSSVDDEWLTANRTGHGSFSVGGFDVEYIRPERVIVARSPRGTLEAFANVLIERTADEVGIDLYRQRRQVEPELRDFLLLSLMEWAKGQGYRAFNLGLGALPGVEAQTADPTERTALHYIEEHIGALYAFRGLGLFADTLHGTWDERYIAFPGIDSLPAVLSAIVRADSGADYALDYIGDFLIRRYDGLVSKWAGVPQ